MRRTEMTSWSGSEQSSAGSPGWLVGWDQPAPAWLLLSAGRALCSLAWPRGQAWRPLLCPALPWLTCDVSSLLLLPAPAPVPAQLRPGRRRTRVTTSQIVWPPFCILIRTFNLDNGGSTCVFRYESEIVVGLVEVWRVLTLVTWCGVWCLGPGAWCRPLIGPLAPPLSVTLSHWSAAGSEALIGCRASEVTEQPLGVPLLLLTSRISPRLPRGCYRWI